MAYPKQDINLVYGIVCGGDDKDPDPAMSGGYRVFVPGQYGNDVKREHLPFARGVAQATQEGVTRFNPPPERGTGVICIKRTGESGTGELVALGTVAGEIGTNGSMPGNRPLHEYLEIMKDSKGHEVSVNIPPEVKEATENGALIRKIQEKGQKHKNELVYGLPTNTSLPNMLGLPLNNLTNVRTAVQQFASSLTPDMLSQLPGKVMNIGDIFNQMPSSIKNEIFSGLPRNLSDGLQNMTNLIQTMESATGSGYATAGRVDPDTFIQNAVDLFKDTAKINSIADIVNIFIRLQRDSSLFGLDKLADAVIEIEDGFGKSNLVFSADGTITKQESDVAKKAAEALQSLMSNGAGFPSAIPGQNFFGGSSKTMQDMFSRLPKEEMLKGIEQMQKAVAPGTDPRAKLVANLKEVMDIGKLVS